MRDWADQENIHNREYAKQFWQYCQEQIFFPVYDKYCIRVLESLSICTLSSSYTIAEWGV